MITPAGLDDQPVHRAESAASDHRRQELRAKLRAPTIFALGDFRSRSPREAVLHLKPSSLAQPALTTGNPRVPNSIAPASLTGAGDWPHFPSAPLSPGEARAWEDAVGLALAAAGESAPPQDCLVSRGLGATDCDRSILQNVDHAAPTNRHPERPLASHVSVRAGRAPDVRLKQAARRCEDHASTAVYGITNFPPAVEHVPPKQSREDAFDSELLDRIARLARLGMDDHGHPEIQTAILMQDLGRVEVRVRALGAGKASITLRCGTLASAALKSCGDELRRNLKRRGVQTAELEFLMPDTSGAAPGGSLGSRFA